MPISKAKAKTEDVPHVVKDYYIGNTHIMICDNYCVRTQEEIDAILKRIATVVHAPLVAQLQAEGAL